MKSKFLGGLFALVVAGCAMGGDLTTQEEAADGSVRSVRLADYLEGEDTIEEKFKVRVQAFLMRNDIEFQVYFSNILPSRRMIRLESVRYAGDGIEGDLLMEPADILLPPKAVERLTVRRPLDNNTIRSVKVSIGYSDSSGADTKVIEMRRLTVEEFKQKGIKRRK